jgi:hypothetical protein
VSEPGDRDHVPEHDEDDYFPRRRGKQVRRTGDHVLTAAEVEANIARLSREMDDLLDEIIDRADAHAKAKHAYKVAFAASRLKRKSKPGNGPGGRTTDAEAEDYALTQGKHPDTDEPVKDLYLAHLIAEAVYEATKEGNKGRIAQASMLQTIAANIRGRT